MRSPKRFLLWGLVFWSSVLLFILMGLVAQWADSLKPF